MEYDRRSIITGSTLSFIVSVAGCVQEPGIGESSNVQLRAPLVGMVAHNVAAEWGEADALQSAIANELEVDPRVVMVHPGEQDSEDGRVEVTTNEATDTEFASLLREHGYNVQEEDIRSGVTPETRERTITVIENKLDAGRITGASVTEERFDNETMIVIEARERDAHLLQQLFEGRGNVHIDAYYPDVYGEYVNETMLRPEQFTTVGTPQQDRDGQYYVPVTVQLGVAEEFANSMTEAGFGDGSDCQFQDYSDVSGRCVLTIRDDRVVHAAGVQPSQGQSYQTSQFVEDPSFRILTPNETTAQVITIDLMAGRLPARLDLDRGEVVYDD